MGVGKVGAEGGAEGIDGFGCLSKFTPAIGVPEATALARESKNASSPSSVKAETGPAGEDRVDALEEARGREG